MAVAKLGMIITEIAGSIGGTTLKRQSGNIAVYNKSRGPNKSVTLKNKALGWMNVVRGVWHSYSTGDKNGWNNVASEYTFPDKFGNQRNITGYQLFTKANNALYAVTGNTINSDGYYQGIEIFSIVDYEISFDTKQCNVGITYSGSGQFFLCGFDVSCKEDSKPIYNKRKIIFSGYDDEDFTMEVNQFFWASFPWVQIGQNVRVYVTPMNRGGYKGVPIYKDFIVR